MAHTIAEIKKEMTDWFIIHPTIKTLYGLQDGRTFEDQFSVVSLESILFYIVAASMWTLEKLFDAFVLLVNTILADRTPHSLRWYANTAKAFQYGYNLDPDTDKYNNGGLTDEQIQTSKIVAYAAVVDKQKEGLLIKVAKDQNNDLALLDAVELEAFNEYMSRVKDAGVNLSIISREADNLKLSLIIHYNPLVLNAQGQRLDGISQTPVADAIRDYLKNLPFNGVLVLAYLVDAIQKVEGVVIPTIRTADYKYGALDWAAINIQYQPESGYLRIADEDLEITYIPQSEII